MARTGKPSPRQAPAFSAAEWEPLNEAFIRSKTALGSGRLAERDLLEHMRSRRLATAVRRASRDGAETFQRLKSLFWKELTLLAPSDGNPVQVRGLSVEIIARSAWYFFVARSDLDKLYPIAAVAHPETHSPPARRKPGPKPTKN